MKSRFLITPFPSMLWLLALLTCFAASETRPAQRPNILLILADQWRAQAFGHAGDPNVQTPHIDRLAQQGIRFVNAVSTVPVCCPARASLLTGQRVLTHGVFLNDVPLKPESVSLAKVLSAAGYDTGYIGKWHLNGNGRSAFIPRDRRQGFDYWKALECTHDYNRSFYYADGPQKLEWEGYDAFAQTRDAQQYLRDHSKKGKPFFLFLAWGPPHDPYQTAPLKYRDLYAPEKLKLNSNIPAESEQKARAALAGYYAHCTALDQCVGDLLQTLRQTGLEENTLVIFTSDHGDLLGAHGGFNKQQPYDESIRVPLIFSWPKALGSQGCLLQPVISLEDLMPTLLGLCHVSIPKTVEGSDYSSYISGGKAPSESGALLACIAPFGQWERRQGGREYRGIRTERYTYVEDLKGPWLLFDNQLDSAQLTNLVNMPTHSSLQRSLETRLRRLLKNSGDEFLSAETYINEWGYKVNENGTVPYAP